MIHLLLNPGSLSFDAGDSLDPHAVIVPQRELNAYDAPRNVGNVPYGTTDFRIRWIVATEKKEKIIYGK